IKTMRYPKLREVKEALSSLFSPAFTTSYPDTEHIPAGKFRGKPVVDNKNCVGCETCANVCPTEAIVINDNADKAIRTITRDYGKCIFCGQCEAFCLTGKGVKLSNTIYDMATFDRGTNIEKQEKELLICSSCGSVITTKEHIMFLLNKLGPKGYSSTLILNQLNDNLIPSTGNTDIEIKDDLKRKDMFNILCPNCQRKIQLKVLS
ncbi:MAG TPA: 4Fe-4S dicluster domain-containing protein, partial [Bacteroidales bacterium]|nr:4Fe-4S dicluster domain-containing protein [Bacteroidales bacterium]